MTNIALVLWIYVALLLVGGLMGFLKAGSKISLISSIAFAIPLSLVALAILPFPVAQGLLAAETVVFVIRYVKTKKVMPAAMLAVLTLVTLVVITLLHR